MKTFDSWAWIEYLKGSKAGAIVRAMVESDEVLSTPAVCLAEIKGKYLSEGRDPEDPLRFVKSRTSIIDTDAGVAEEAADLKFDHGLHMVDALVLACARTLAADLVTGDRHFRGIDGVVMLES